MKRTSSLGPLALAVACFLQPGLGSYWTATQLYVKEPLSYTYGCGTTGGATQQCSTSTITHWNFAVTHAVTSIPTGVTPVSIRTTTTPSWDIEIVNVYLPAGAVPQSDLVDYFEATTTTTRKNPPSWVVDLTFTAPASCPTPFEYTTTTRLGPWDFPSPLSAILRPKATVETQLTRYTRTIVTSSEGFPRVTSIETLTETSTYFHLKPTDVAPTLRPHTDDDRFSVFNSYYIQNCDTPETAEERWRLQELSKCPENYHAWSGGCHPIALWAVIVVAVVSFFFFLGLIENFFWFRRLMQGKGSFRFGTVSWFCLGLFVAFFTTFEKARSPDDQERLKEQWKALPLGMKLKLWIKWGFRHKYPVEWLGARKPLGEEESIEMGSRSGGARASGSTVNPGPGAQDGENDMPLPAYPGPPSSRISDTHSMSSGTTVAHTGPVLGNPNAVLAPASGSGTVVIGPTMSSAQPQTATQRAEADRGADDGFRAL
ncbi:hypothetical protein QBC40DRAFT_288834 [Triangularia verruculosa]|uniref:Uncharacterized protein n=1 Tax=Triangularia verruculosa TaxID=2587418 RepID=A0AAN6X842_9PEZI|nr:hypothetical protein QBC40DRAFT_288834 [Triangularia verruculosa]